MSVRLEELVHSFGKEQVLRGVSLMIERGSFVSLVGPSGAGKTTLLKIIAGLELPDAGRVQIDSKKDLRRHPPILVFQDYMLFPYMNVFENVAFGLRARRMSKERVRTRVEEMLSFFQIEEKAREYPAKLSGGQQQRVALARALVIQPELLLLDEPYANLDRSLKMDTAAFLRRTQRRFGITTVCVTHDIEEALAVSDTLGILLNGRLEDYGHPERVYSRPASLAGARFLGELNEIPAAMYPSLGLRADSPCVYARSEELELHPDSGGAAAVEAVRFVGKAYLYEVNIEGLRLSVYSASGGISPGERVRLKLHRYHVPCNGANGAEVRLQPAGERQAEGALNHNGDEQEGIACEAAH